MGLRSAKSLDAIVISHVTNPPVDATLCMCGCPPFPSMGGMGGDAALIYAVWMISANNYVDLANEVANNIMKSLGAKEKYIVIVTMMNFPKGARTMRKGDGWNIKS